MKRNRQSHGYMLVLCAMLLSIIMPTEAQVPSDLMENCNQWKITYPTGSEDKTLCGEPNNEYFYLNDSGDAIVFRAPIRSNNGTTPNSSYIRSELREREADGKSDIYWTTAGSHFIYVKQAITHLPINKPYLVATQIHGDKDAGIDDAMVLRLENAHLFLSFNGGVLRSDVTIKTNYSLGTVHEVIFLINNGKHYCYYAEDGNLLSAYNKDSASSYLIKDGSNDYVMDRDYDQSYFKIGNYTQSNADKEGTDTGDPDNYGEVLVYDFSVNHGGGAVSGVSVTPSSLDLTVGSTVELSAEVSPANATNKKVSYSSSDESIASVNVDGEVSAIAQGAATISITTDEGAYTATCQIKVVPEAVGPNLALDKSIVGTGTHDGDNEVVNLVDGSTSSRWSVSGYPQSATVDLGQAYEINRIEVACYQDRAYQYTVSVSDTEDGTYTNIVDRIDNTTSGFAAHPLVDLFADTEARFVKIELTGANVYTGSWVSLSELRVYGGETAATHFPIAADDIVLYPNPSADLVYIKGAKDFDLVEIYNQTGAIVHRQYLPSSFIDLFEFNTGLYVFKFSGKNATVTKRVFKKR